MPLPALPPAFLIAPFDRLTHRASARPLRVPGHRFGRGRFVCVLAALLLSSAFSGEAAATVAMLQPARIAAANEPLQITLLYS
ncbi:MAG: phospholipase, partial [Paraburkholderia graminis]